MRNSAFLLVLVNLLVVFAQENDEIPVPVPSFYTPQEEQMLDVCSEEYNTYINKTEFKLYGSLPDETHHESKCLFFCVPKKLSITDDTGVIDPIQIKDLITSRHPSLSSPVVKAVIKKCTRRLDIDVCNRWYRLTKCIWNMFLNSRRRAYNRRIRLGKV